MFSAVPALTHVANDVHSLPSLPATIAGLIDGLEIVATRRLGNRDDARDAAQEVIARLLERANAGAIASDAEIAPIAWGIARHVIADVQRERARRVEELGEIAHRGPDPLEALVREAERESVRAAMQRLPAGDQKLLHRCFVDGERVGRIAEDLGEPPERVRKRKSRALRRLASILESRPANEGHGFDSDPMEGL